MCLFDPILTVFLLAAMGRFSCAEAGCHSKTHKTGRSVGDNDRTPPGGLVR